MKRGEVYWCDLNPVIGSEQGGVRPVVIVQNRKGNKYAPTVTVCPISKMKVGRPLPTHVIVMEPLNMMSCILCEQVRTVDEHRLKRYIGQASKTVMREVDKALKIQLGV